MRIERPVSASGVTSSRKSASSAGAAAFGASLSKADGSPRAAAPLATSQLSSVAALMALQGVEDPLERRRKAERRGRQLLSGLDQLNLDMLEERDPLPSLSRLKGLLENDRDDSGDSALESLIDQVELRVEVELAKRLRR